MAPSLLFLTPQEDDLLVSLVKSATDRGSDFKRDTWVTIAEQMEKTAFFGGFFIDHYQPESLESRWYNFLSMRRDPWSMRGNHNYNIRPAGRADLPNIEELGKNLNSSDFLTYLTPLQPKMDCIQPPIRTLEQAWTTQGPPKNFDEALFSRSRGKNLSRAKGEGRA